ncbi:hypothetical protein GCM10010363_46950 [Streptomyces omiyaensis]|uniref:hypothetical protein n=1 Tax=Streptomyces omiyaensis TaxID=68247 RepID=UPI0019CCADDB|nr:hypothetical protein [Streptomyces omiyaensis]GGY60055.1 hypothetical protein GCM10010363_46950 [Streptomyces omiyaensis]
MSVTRPSRPLGEIRPLLAERGRTISPGVRLRTPAEVVDHLGASGQTGIIGGTEIRVRRPAAGRKDRDVFLSGKNKVEHGIAPLKNGRALARHLGRHERINDTVRAVAGLLPHQQTADLDPRRPR